MSSLKSRLLATVMLTVAPTFVGAGAAQAALSVSGSVGGAPTGVILDNLDWLTLGSGGGVSPQSGITVSFAGGGSAVRGSRSGRYAAPFLSGGNGAGFGNPIGTANQPNGINTTTYATTAANNSSVTLLLPGNGGLGYRYFGLLWGSVDSFNTLSFFNGATLIGAITGSAVTASPNGNQGVAGTLYVNITSTLAFDRVVATSSQFAFEFDNIAFNPTVPVPAPAALGLFAVGLLGLAWAARRRA